MVVPLQLRARVPHGRGLGMGYAVDPELWWVGLIAGFLLAITVEMTLAAALERPHVPEPALAASSSRA